MAELSLFSDVGSVSDAVTVVIETAVEHFDAQRRAAVEAKVPLREGVEKVVTRVQGELPEAEFQLIMRHDDTWQLNVYSDASSRRIQDLVEPVRAELTGLQLTIVLSSKSLAQRKAS